MSERQHYLRIGELARRTGVSPELLRAWEQRYGLLRPSRSPGGFRLYSDADEARVLRAKALIATGVATAEAARRVLAAEPSGGPPDTPLVAELASRLASSLGRFDEDGAHAAFDELLASVSVESALEDVVLPYLSTLGDRWARGDASIAQEHFASSLIRGRLLGLARGWGAHRGPSVVLACPPGEEHELGLIAFGILIARRGWRVTYLGANTPFDTLEATVRSLKPSLAVLSVSSPDRLASHADRVRSLAAIATVAIGGAVGPADVEGLGVRLLEGDVAAAARSVAIEAFPAR
jgi:DNA-binding transcriptional MerR regulator